MRKILKQRKFILIGLAVCLIVITIYMINKKQDTIEIDYSDMNEQQQEEFKLLTESTQISDDRTKISNAILNINVKLNNELTFATLHNSTKLLHNFADGVFEQDKIVILAYNTCVLGESLQQFYMLSQKFDTLDDYTAQIYADNLTTNIIKNLKADPSITDVHILPDDPEALINGFARSDIFNFQVTYTQGVPGNYLSVDAYRCDNRLIFLCYQSTEKPTDSPFIVERVGESNLVNQ